MKILIAGGGQTAALVAARLIREGNEVVIVEQDPDRCQELDEVLDAKIVKGSAVSISTLRNAGIGNAEMLIALTNVDYINALFFLIASVESRAKIRVARMRTHEVKHWNRIYQEANIPIDLIIHPETDIADRIMRVVQVPGVSDVVDFADGQVKLFSMRVDADMWMVNKRLEELGASGFREHGIVAMILRGHQAVIPHGDETLQPGDHVYIVTRAEDIEDAYQFMGLRTRESLERVFILGGKQVGIEVAQQLEKRGVAVKLFEQDPVRCEMISKILERTIVIRADGTDEAILMEENVGEVEAVLALMGHDEDNIMASLLARKLGVPKVVALINRLNYMPMVMRLGITTAISPRLTAADRILRFVRRGRIISVTSFGEVDAESIELIAAPRSRVVGQKLRNLKLPRECVVGAIRRTTGEVIVPRGEDSIQGGDRVICFVLSGAVKALESTFFN